MTASPLAIESDISDEALMTLIACGDDDAFQTLVKRYQSLLIGIVTRMMGSADAEDMAQQVFLNIWKSAPRWRPEAKVTTWMLTIAKRMVFNESRRRVRARLISQNQKEEEEQDYPDPVLGPDAQLLQYELHLAIESAMALLPENERFALVLSQYQQMSYEEIAEVLGVSLGAVKSLIFRGRKKLKVTLHPYLTE